MVDMASFVIGAASACAVIAVYVILERVIKDKEPEPRPKKDLARWIFKTDRRLSDLELALAMRMCRGEPVPDAVVLPSSPERRVVRRAIEREIEMDPDVELDAVFDSYGRLCGREKEALRASILARQAKG